VVFAQQPRIGACDLYSGKEMTTKSFYREHFPPINRQTKHHHQQQQLLQFAAVMTFATTTTKYSNSFSVREDFSKECKKFGNPQPADQENEGRAHLHQILLLSEPPVLCDLILQENGANILKVQDNLIPTLHY